MPTSTDPLGNTVILHAATLRKHIYRRHPELRGKEKQILHAVVDPDLIARSKKDDKSLLYFKRVGDLFYIMVVGTPTKTPLLFVPVSTCLTHRKAIPLYGKKQSLHRVR